MSFLDKIFKPKRQKPDLSFLNSSLGNYSYYGPNCLIHNTTIANFTSIGPNCVIGFGEHPTNRLSTSPVFYEHFFTNELNNNDFFGKQPVNIGNDVWIGANVFIRNGINVGNGAIIGANSVVLKDVEPFSIIVGCPAKKIRTRFTSETIALIDTISWWNKEIKDLQKIKFIFSLESENEIIQELLKLK